MADQGTAGNGDAGSHQQRGPGGGGSSGGAGQFGGAPAQGRSFRQSQYAEAIANPLPELAVVPEAEPVSNLAQLECDDTASSTRAVVQPDDISDHRPSAIVYAGEKPTVWRKYRAPVIVALIVAVIVLVGTVVGVVVRNSNKDHSPGASPSNSATSTSSTPTLTTGSSSVSTSSSASSTGSSVRSTVTSSVSMSSSSPKKKSSSSSSTTSSLSVFPTPATSPPSNMGIITATQPGGASSPVPSQCADTSDFVTSVSFMGVNGNGGWKTAYCGTASSSKDCCACCYKNKDGCNSWAYMPSTGFAGTACALIVGWDTGDDKDSTCPSGHGAGVYFTTDSDHDSDVGAAGPCGTVDS